MIPEHAEEIASELQHLIAVSSRLREAMLARDPELIQSIVGEQEALRPSVALLTATPELLEDEEVGRLAQRLRRLQESNRFLATTFSRLYRNMLQPRSVATTTAGSAYGRYGREDAPTASPLLIRQTG